MPFFNIPLPDGYYIARTRIFGIAEDRIGTGNRDGVYSPDRKDGVVMKIGIAADDETGQRYGATIKATGNLAGFEGVSRVPSKDEECFIIHQEKPFYNDGEKTIAYEISAIFDLDGNLIYHKPTGLLVYELQKSITSGLKLDTGSIED